MCVATFMIQLDVTVVNVALPRIQAGLGMGPGGLEWVIGAYALSLAALIPAGGALGDHYGRKRMFLAGMAVFTIGSAACALSPNAGLLIASRAVQGVGGAAMLALTLSIITETFPAEQRAAAIGSWAAIGGTGFGFGPVVGGLLLTYFSWASVFWVNIPLAVVGIAASVLAVRESRDEASRRLDRVGLALSASGLVAVTLGLVDSSSHRWGSRPVSVPLAVGVMLLVAFVLWERRIPHAMVPPSLLRTRSFASATLIYLAGYTAFAGALFYVTLLYQDAIGWSVLRTGASWLFMNIPFLCLAQLAGRLDRRFSAGVVVGAGSLLAGAGMLALSFASPGAPFLVTAVGYALSGAGFGVLVPTLTHVAMRDVASGMSGVASGVLNAARQLGTALGLAVLGTIGVRAAIAHWHAATVHLAQPVRGIARRHAQDVGGARIAAVTKALGPSYRHAATASFVHGYHLAVASGACCLFIAAVVAAVGFGRTPEAATVGMTTSQEMACQANSTS
ncbi:MAG TPA: MFS transporter [Jatrophihabitantaceae bacterium]